ncbi:MAG: sigma-70 family RNA polymerase sigma factor [Nannocystaceae bacterium]|nr:sigma-70 family RNA polymerase sigma factor [Nannocystaceae bacterium]
MTLRHRRAQCWAVQDEDFVLLDRWKDGNTDAGDELMRRHFDSLCNFFRSKVDSGVEDLVQDVLLRCVERREQFRGEASFRTYLFVIARRILLDRLRKEYRRGTPLNFSEVSLVDLGTTPSQAVARDQGRAVLIAALRELPVDFQIAVELTYWENLSAPEVGRVLGINPNTVRSRLARARKALDGTLRLLEERTDKMTET